MLANPTELYMVVEWAVKKISSDFSDFDRWIIIALEAHILTVASL